MRRTPIRKAIFIALLTPALLAPGLLQADNYRYMSREKLKAEIKDWVGKGVTCVDRLVMLYDREQQGYIRFDTRYFRCAIKSSDPTAALLKKAYANATKGFKDLTKKLEEEKDPAKRRELLWEVHKRWKDKPLVKLYGKVDRPKLFGDVKGESNGVVSELIIIMCDRVEKPRKRFYDEIK